MTKLRADSAERRVRRIAIVALALLLTVLLAGCGKRSNVTTVRFTSWGNDVEEANLRALIAEFEKRHPDIKVEIEITPWARMFDKLMISSAGGRPPDVTRISSEWFPPIAAKGLLEPLEPYVKRDNYDLDDFYPEAIEAWGKYNGVLYEIPTDIDIYAMYYNKDMFDKYKLPYPDWDWDWDNLVEVGRKLTRDLDGDGRLDQWGCAPDMWWEDYVHANGGTILSPDNKECTLDRPAAYKGLQFMADLVHKYKIAPTPEDAQSLGMSKLFTSGKIAMNISGSWAAELIYKNEIKDFTYDVGPIPAGPKGRASFFGGAAYAILSRSKHKEEAWELVKWMTGKEYQTSAAVRSQIIPSRRSVAESEAYLKLKSPPANRKVFLDMIPYGRRIPGVPCSPEMYSIIVNELDKVRLGKESAKTACQNIKVVVDELLRHSD